MSRLWGSGGEYQAWADHLERWARGERPDPGRLPALAREQFPTDTWERLTARLTGALSTGLQSWADALTAAMSADADDEFAVGRVLAQARDGLRTVLALAAHPALPADLRARLRQLTECQVARVQEDLERALRGAAAVTEPRLYEARLRTLRDNPLTAVLAEGAGRRTDAAGWDHDPAAPSRRRVIRP